MARLYYFIAVFLLSCWSTRADDFGTSLTPTEIEGSTLDVPVNGRRQLSFTVSYVENESLFRPVLIVNGTLIPIGSNEYESRGYLHIVRRRCDDSNRLGVRCELLQLTVNGNFSNATKLEFGVFVGFTRHYLSQVITVNIVDEEDLITTIEDLETTGAPVVRSTEPDSVASTTQPDAEADIEAQRSECRQILTVEIVVPWVFVAVLAILLLLTIGLLIIVIYRNRGRKLDYSNEGDRSNHESIHLRPPGGNTSTSSSSPSPSPA